MIGLDAIDGVVLLSASKSAQQCLMPKDQMDGCRVGRYSVL